MSSSVSSTRAARVRLAGFASGRSPTLHSSSLRLPVVCAAGGDSGSSSDTFDPQICVVLGTQWGDEGKGKLVDVLAQEYGIVARAQGGANAGHTIYDLEGNKYKLHLIPSGILNPSATCVVGNGVVVHLPGIFDEIKGLEERGIKVQGRLIISDRAHLLFDMHKEIDGLREAELQGTGKQIGTTKRGIGPAYSSKATRNGIRVGDLVDMDQFAEKLRKLALDGQKRFEDFEYDVEKEIVMYREIAKTVAPYVQDTVHYINEAAKAGKKILIEGANATLLDVDFGTYPFVTSSNPSIGGVLTGLGIAPTRLGAIIGVVKAYTTRVGEGPYPTELFGDLAEELRETGAVGIDLDLELGRLTLSLALRASLVRSFARSPGVWDDDGASEAHRVVRFSCAEIRGGYQRPVAYQYYQAGRAERAG